MKTLDQLRTEIDSIDNELLTLFTKRFDVVEQVGRLKKEQKLSVRNEKREKEILTHLSQKATQLSLSDTFVQSIWKAIFAESYKKEN